MEELLAYAILLYEEIIIKELFQKKIDELFLENYGNEILLNLECEKDINNAIVYIGGNVDYNNFNYVNFLAPSDGDLRSGRLSGWFKKVYI